MDKTGVPNKKKFVLAFLFVTLLLIVTMFIALSLRFNLFAKYSKKQVQPKLVQKTNLIQSSLKLDFKTYFLDLSLDEKSGILTKISAEQTNTSHPY